MLVLSRRLNETIFMSGNIAVKILKITGNNVVSLGIEAPQDVEIWREDAVCTHKKKKEISLNSQKSSEEVSFKDEDDLSNQKTKFNQTKKNKKIRNNF